MRPAATLLLLMLASACTQPGELAPLLAPRATEAIDPRVPVEASAPAATPVDPALAAKLADLVAQARAGERAFSEAAAYAERMVAAAGAERSESWVAAQQAISTAVASRAPTTRALGDIDELAASAITDRGGLSPADRAAIQAAAAEVGAIDRAQAAVIDSLQARLAA